MSKHKSEDYKITAVKYYLENDTNYTKTCEIFKCSERSLKRWIERYEELEFIHLDYIFVKNQLEYIQKELILLELELELEMEINQLKTQLYESNITLQKQTKEINQLNKKLGEEQICHYLTKKLCILPRN